MWNTTPRLFMNTNASQSPWKPELLQGIQKDPCLFLPPFKGQIKHASANHSCWTLVLCSLVHHHITSHLLLWSEWAIFLSSSTTLLEQHHCSLSILALLGWIFHIARQIASPELAVQWVVRDSIHYPLPQGIIGRLHSRIVSLSLYPQSLIWP